jgi:hypothetical protein
MPNPMIDAATLAELERLARSRPRSGRQAAAKASAIRTLERLGRGNKRVPLLPCPPDWHPGPPEFEELDRLYLEEHPEVRERWWRALHGWGGDGPAADVLHQLGPSTASRPKQ